MGYEPGAYALSLAAERRWHAEAAKGTLSAHEVAILLNPNAPDPARVTQLLTAGQLLGVFHEGEMRFPAYQFNGAAVRKVIPVLVAVGERNELSAWDIVLWMITPSSLFAARDRPMDHLDDPERLLAAAQAEFETFW